jgi:broad specificity phosphatase PhoE
VRGWERAIDAQQRIVRAIERAHALVSSPQPVAIVSHGGVGTLLLCHLKGVAISRREEQPGTAGGNYFAFALPAGTLVHGWRPIDAEGPG